MLTGPEDPMQAAPCITHDDAAQQPEDPHQDQQQQQQKLAEHLMLELKGEFEAFTAGTLAPKVQQLDKVRGRSQAEGVGVGLHGGMQAASCMGMHAQACRGSFFNNLHPSLNPHVACTLYTPQLIHHAVTHANSGIQSATEERDSVSTDIGNLRRLIKEFGERVEQVRASFIISINAGGPDGV